jgi:hypothetical protein
LGCAAGEDLVAHPFALAEVLPMVAPVGFEARVATDAFEFRDLVEQVREPGDEHGDRREPVVLGRGVVGLERRSVEAHGRDYTCAGSPAGLRSAFPQIFCGKLLRLLRVIFWFPPNPYTRFPTKGGVTFDIGYGFALRAKSGPRPSPGTRTFGTLPAAK